MAGILLIGVNHFDPFGRKNVAQALNCAARNGFVPEAIAVEWKEDHAKSVIGQRGLFRALAAKQFSSATEFELDTLTNSLAYEADVHKQLYPSIPIIWLDQYREDAPESIGEYAKGRVLMYRQHTDNPGELNLNSLSERILSMAEKPNQSKQRDALFFSVVSESIKKFDYKRIVCIVGKSHADINFVESFGNQLLHAGHSILFCNATELPVSIETPAEHIECPNEAEVRKWT